MNCSSEGCPDYVERYADGGARAASNFVIINQVIMLLFVIYVVLCKIEKVRIDNV
jgi:hypothetical protein